MRLFRHNVSLVAALAGALVALATLALAQTAQATLGGGVDTVAANAQTLGAPRRVVKLDRGIERHELSLATGGTVSEYVSPSGVVYGVAWSGARPPNLRELLGPYFERLSHKDPGLGHHRMSVTTTDFLLRSMGHRGRFAGRAWVPALVPAGIRPEVSLEGAQP